MPRTIDVAEPPSALAAAPGRQGETLVLRQGGEEAGLIVPFASAPDEGRSRAEAARVDAEVVAARRRRQALRDLRAVRREVAARNPGVTEEQAMADALAAIEEVRAEQRAAQR